MRVVRTRDLSVINAVFKHPENVDMLGDDGSEDVEYPITDIVFYLAVYDGVDLCGLFMLFPLNSITLDTHVAFMPEFRGKKALIAGQMMMSWVARNTQFKKLVACIPAINRACCAYAVQSGYTREGVNRASFIKNGVVYDQYYFGKGV